MSKGASISIMCLDGSAASGAVAVRGFGGAGGGGREADESASSLGAAPAEPAGRCACDTRGFASGAIAKVTGASAGAVARGSGAFAGAGEGGVKAWVGACAAAAGLSFNQLHRTEKYPNPTTPNSSAIFRSSASVELVENTRWVMTAPTNKKMS